MVEAGVGINFSGISATDTDYFTYDIGDHFIFMIHKRNGTERNQNTISGNFACLNNLHLKKKETIKRSG